MNGSPQLQNERAAFEAWLNEPIALPIFGTDQRQDAMDAARYRFLRDADPSDARPLYCTLVMYAAQALDEAIDDAMQHANDVVGHV